MGDDIRQPLAAYGGSVRLSAIEQALSLICLAPPAKDLEVDTGFASDVLSEVLARAPQGCILVTAQSSVNVIAVASQAEIAGVIVTSCHEPGMEVVMRAREGRIALYATPLETFDVIGRLSQLGLKGRIQPRRRGHH